MQPKNPLWNYVFFFLLSALIWIGTVSLQNWLYPPKPLPPVTPAEAKRRLEETSTLLPRILGSALAPGVPGIGNATQIFADTTVGGWLVQRSFVLPELVVEKPKPAPPKERPKAVVQNPVKHEEIQIGNDDSSLKAVLTTRGGGVQSVELTQFRAATAMGRPAADDAKEELIRKDVNQSDPSNVLYAYDKPDADNPDDTLATTEWAIESNHFDADAKRWEVTFGADVPGQDIRILKTYSLGAEDYHLGLRIEIRRKGLSKDTVKFRYQLTGGHGLPIEGEWYTSIYRNALVGQKEKGQGKNFWRDFQDSRSIGAKEGGERVNRGPETMIQYAAVAVQYFASAVVIDNEQQKQDFIEWVRPTTEGKLDAKKPYLDDINVRLVSEAIEMKPDAPPVVHKYLLYNGPVKVRLLDDMASGSQAAPAALVDRYLNKLHLDTFTDFQSPGAFGNISGAIGWSYLLIKITNLMHAILGFLHWLIPNYGVCIILLTILVRGLMHPVSRKQAKTSIKMQALMPELKQLQEKLKGDRQAMAMAQMELYRKHGVSPVGSCWVVLLQMPIFLGLYYSLQESIHFRLAPFVWIKNLAAPDMLIWWGQNIPWISRPEDQGSLLYLGPYFNLLPVVAVTFMIIQQKFLMPPAADETQEMQQKMMKYMMIFFGLMFYKVAAGLCLYFIVSSVWGLTERQLLPKAKPKTDSAAAQGGRGGASGKPAPSRPKPRGPKNGATDGPFKKVQGMWEELLKQAKKK